MATTTNPKEDFIIACINLEKCKEAYAQAKHIETGTKVTVGLTTTAATVAKIKLAISIAQAAKDVAAQTAAGIDETAAVAKEAAAATNLATATTVLADATAAADAATIALTAASAEVAVCEVALTAALASNFIPFLNWGPSEEATVIAETALEVAKAEEIAAAEAKAIVVTELVTATVAMETATGISMEAVTALTAATNRLTAATAMSVQSAATVVTDTRNSNIANTALAAAATAEVAARDNVNNKKSDLTDAQKEYDRAKAALPPELFLK